MALSVPASRGARTVRAADIAPPSASTRHAARALPAGPGAALGRSTLADRLATLLSEQIDTGRLAPGDRLPTEQQLCASHGVSRSVVREAVHRVKSRGLLVSRQGSGVFVSVAAQHRPLAFDPAVLDSVDAVVHVVELRRVLEGEMAALAAERASRAHVTQLRRALVAIDAASADGRDGVAEDLALHRAIGQATGNPQFGLLLAYLEQYVRHSMRVTRGHEAGHADLMAAVQVEHRSIVDAIAAHDPTAARDAAIGHLRNSALRLRSGRGVARSKAGSLKR